jgi:hypothetical protein
MTFSASGEPSTLTDSVPLCSVLEKTVPGKRVSAVITGVYSVGPEHQVFYDPRQLRCNQDIQPATWVEFAPTAGQNRELLGLLEEHGRALVTFSGDVFGPSAVAADNAELPVYVAFANRVFGRRYGHLGAFRTKFLVHSVLKVNPAPEAAPPPISRPPAPASEDLTVNNAAVPRYPAMARRAGIAGKVTLRVFVSEGAVAAAELVDGDRILAEAAEQNVATWTFDSEVTATFDTEFDFELLETFGSDQNWRVEMQPPGYVKVVAPSFGW